MPQKYWGAYVHRLYTLSLSHFVNNQLLILKPPSILVLFVEPNATPFLLNLNERIKIWKHEVEKRNTSEKTIGGWGGSYSETKLNSNWYHCYLSLQKRCNLSLTCYITVRNTEGEFIKSPFRISSGPSTKNVRDNYMHLLVPTMDTITVQHSFPPRSLCPSLW